VVLLIELRQEGADAEVVRARYVYCTVCLLEFVWNVLMSDNGAMVVRVCERWLRFVVTWQTDSSFSDLVEKD
jgi:hypothetical protein